MKKTSFRPAHLILLVIALAVLYWFMLPPIHPQSPLFWRWLLIGVLVVWFLDALKKGTLGSGRIPTISRMPNGQGVVFNRPSGGKNPFAQNKGADPSSSGASEEKKDGPEAPSSGKKSLSFLKIALVLIGVIAVMTFLSGSWFHAGTYSSRMIPAEGEALDLPTVEDVDHISLMDTDSARILGDRVIGSLSDVVSQFEVSYDYTTLVYDDTIIKVSPLEYGGFFKYMNNRTTGAPGYVIVDTQSFDARFVRLEKGILYSPYGYFFRYLPRHIRLCHPTKLLGTSRFEIDEDGHPYWVTPVYGRRFLFGGDYIKGAVITDPSGGDSSFYENGQVPEWVDNLLTGDFACELYDSYGMLRNGWINSVIGQKGCLKTTDDFGYLAKGNDLFIYTGVTSVNADESNLGFIMVNARTSDCTYVSCAGAEEYSAMTAAQGMVQNYGYQASFPSLVTVDGEPTYVMVLKDRGGLVKDYAAVNVRNYTLVAVEPSLNAAIKSYRRTLSSGVSADTAASQESTEKTVTLANVVFADTEGNTFAYLIDEAGTIYKIAVAADETVVALTAGDSVTVTYPVSFDGAEVIPVSDVLRE